MNQSTSGAYTMLFPREDTGSENQIHAGKDYVVPATQTLFRIAGPAGHEIVYWMITPAELRSEEERPNMSRCRLRRRRTNSCLPNLTPRCDDALFRARGACIDTSAGPKA